MPIWASVSKMLRLLTLQISKEELLQLNRQDLCLGLVCTWLVGMGRYWDKPDAHLLQHLGITSIAYVFAFAAIAWLMLMPLRIPQWHYEKVLTFVSLTALPAILYAIPVERVYDLDAAQDINVGFLAIVSVWRVLLWILFINRYTPLSASEKSIVTLFPLSAIVSVLALFGEQRAAFDLMSGGGGGALDIFVLIVGIIAMLSAIPLLIAYLIVILNRFFK